MIGNQFITSDDDDFLPKKDRALEQVEAIVRTDAVCNICSPECVSPLNEIDKILDCEMRPTIPSEEDSSEAAPKQVCVKQYLVKWMSYLHCSCDETLCGQHESSGC
ncbi:unnamed protein product [Microthlaspi erraticum]|uniref:Uncharacterized protein n=1 Tax=Microthlaspi erraticum TaxID=1685480 RepID=A0A6D2KPY2_9BRAS|nr:unnamed protein product [Microthlaspi erraticum]CAA7054009.1 unnamed protein product [Microthlaspi erraticum]